MSCYSVEGWRALLLIYAVPTTETARVLQIPPAFNYFILAQKLRTMSQKKCVTSRWHNRQGLKGHYRDIFFSFSQPRELGRATSSFPNQQLTAVQCSSKRGTQVSKSQSLVKGTDVVLEKSKLMHFGIENTEKIIRLCFDFCAAKYLWWCYRESAQAGVTG